MWSLSCREAEAEMGIKKRAVLLVFVLVFLAAVILLYGSVNSSLRKAFGNTDLNAGEKTTIHFIHWSDFPKDIFTSFSGKYPGIQVEFEQFGLQQFPQVQKARIASGANMDLMGVIDSDYSRFIEKGYLEDLTGKEYLGNYEPGVVEALSRRSPEGKIFSVAYRSWVLGMWYNKILFNKYYLKVPENYNDFINVCSVLKLNGVSPLVLGCRDQSISSYLYFLRIWNGAGDKEDWFNGLNTGELKWTDKKVASSFAEAEDFLKSGFLLKESANLTYHQAFYKFVNGQAAMCLMGDWSLDMIDADVEEVCDLGVFPVPYNDKNGSIRVPGVKAGLLIGAFSRSSHKKEADLLLDHLSRKETAQYYSDQTMSRSTVKGVTYEKLKYDELWEPLRKKELIAPISAVAGPEMQQALDESARELLMGVKSPLQIVGELQERQEEVNAQQGELLRKTNQ